MPATTFSNMQLSNSRLDLQELAYRLEKMGKSVAVINCTGFRSAAEMKADIMEGFDKKVYKFLDNTGEK